MADVNFKALENEYFAPTENDDDLLLEYKEAIWTDLNEAERRILAIFLDLNCVYTTTGKFFGVSTPTIRKKILKIFDKIK